MQHIFAITEKHMPLVNHLMNHKMDGEFVILAYSGSFCDIAQWSDKFQNIKILTVPTNKLDMSNCIS